MNRCPAIPLLAAIALAACTGPFGPDRRELAGLRIAAVQTVPTGQAPGNPIVPRAAFVQDGRLWSDEPLTVRWWWTLDPRPAAIEALDPEEAVATGAAVTLTVPDDDDFWGAEGAGASVYLVVEADDGEDARRARLEVITRAPPAAAVLERVEMSQLGWDLDEPASLSLATLDRMDSQPTEAVGYVDPGVAARFEAVYGSITSEVPFTRWMMTAPAGTFLELDGTRADWVPGTLEQDDGEVVGHEAGPTGPRTLVALALHSERPRTEWRAVDVWVGEPPTGLWTASQRWIAVDDEALASAEPGTLVRGTLTADDGAPTGLALEGAAILAADALPDDDPYGTAALPCTGDDDGDGPSAGRVGLPFDPSWLATRRCTRDEVVGATVVLTVGAAP